MIEKNTSLSNYIDFLQKGGTYFIQKRETAGQLGTSYSRIHVEFSRLVARKRIFRIQKDFYGIIPLEYQDNGATPPDWFIDPVMSSIYAKYYVGLLSAASIHGATHQQPMNFQVITDKTHIRDIHIKKMTISFYKKKSFPTIGLTKIKTTTGYMFISEPELTLYDLIKYPKAAGHLNNIATVFDELGDLIKANKLKDLAESTASDKRDTVYWQRIGYLLDQLGFENKTIELYDHIKQINPDFGYLSPMDKKNSHERSDKWRLYINTTFETDL